VIPAVLVLLPDTRLRAKLRMGHVLRGAVYGLAWILPALALRGVCRVLLALDTLTAVSATPTGGWPTFHMTAWFHAARLIVMVAHQPWFIWMSVFMLWIMAWWWFALRVGWRVREYDRVWWAAMVPAWLAAAVAVAATDDGFRMFA
jgi:hypothetical protein